MVASLVLFFPLFEANGGGESNIHSRLYVQKLNLPPFAQKLFAFRLCVFVCLFALEVIVQTNCGWGAGDPSRPHLAHQKVAETSESQAEAGQKKKHGICRRCRGVDFVLGTVAIKQTINTKKICEILLKSQPKNGETILENIRMLLGFVIKLEVDKRTTVQL